MSSSCVLGREKSKRETEGWSKRGGGGEKHHAHTRAVSEGPARAVTGLKLFNFLNNNM